MGIFGLFGRGSRIQRLANALASPELKTREGAAAQLAAMGTAEAARALVEGLRPTHNLWFGRHDVLVNTLRACGRQGVSVLIEGLLDAHPDLQAAIAEALVGLATAEALPALMELLGRDNDALFYARTNAAAAIGGLGPSAAEAVPLLAQHLAARDPHKREHLADACRQALERIGPAAVPHVLPLLADPAARPRAIAVLDHLDARNREVYEAMKALWGQLERQDPSLLRYLVRCAPEESADLLREALASPESVRGPDGPVYVDATAAQCLRSLQEAHPAVVESLRDAVDGAVRRIVAELRKLAAGKNVSPWGRGEAVLRLAHFGSLAAPAVGELRALAQSVANRRFSIWLTGVLAAVDADPRPHIRHLCAVMDAADRGYRDTPEAQAMRSAGRSDIASAVGYMAAWAAGSPAMTAQDTLEAVAKAAAGWLRPVLEELAEECPNRLEPCLEAIAAKS